MKFYKFKWAIKKVQMSKNNSKEQKHSSTEQKNVNNFQQIGLYLGLG